MRAKPPGGFTIIELLATFILIGFMAAIAAPRFGQAMASNRVKNAAAVLRADMELAFSLASRQGAPVRIEVDGGALVYRIKNRADDETLHERRFGAGSDFPLNSLAPSQDEIVVYPNGLASGPLEVTLASGNRTMQVRMTRTGLVRTEGS